MLRRPLRKPGSRNRRRPPSSKPSRRPPAKKASPAAVARTQAQRLCSLLDHLAQPLAHLDAEVETALVQLALQVGRRLAQHELSLDVDKLGGVVREAIAALTVMPAELRVHLHPEDARLLKDRLTPPPEVNAWRLVPDNSLQRGDCRIAGDTGWVDATLQTRVASIAQSLFNEPVTA